MRSAANLLFSGLAWSGRQGSVLLAFGIFGGVIFPAMAAALHGLITADVLLMMTLVLLRVDVGGTLLHLRRPAGVAVVIVAQLLLSPLVAWAVTAPLGLDPAIAGGVVIFAAGCAATSSPAFARMVGLDPELALIVSLVTTFLVPLTAPPIALWLMGIDLAISPAAFMGRLLVVVGLPTLISLALRRVIGRDRLPRYGDAVDGLLVWLVVIYGFAVVDGLGQQAQADPGWVLGALAAAFAADYGLNLLTTLALLPLGARFAATAGLMSGNRNMALFLAVLPPDTDPRLVLFFGLCQFPLFLSPFLLRPAYRRLDRRGRRMPASQPAPAEASRRAGERSYRSGRGG